MSPHPTRRAAGLASGPAALPCAAPVAHGNPVPSAGMHLPGGAGPKTPGSGDEREPSPLPGLTFTLELPAGLKTLSLNDRHHYASGSRERIHSAYEIRTALGSPFLVTTVGSPRKCAASTLCPSWSRRSLVPMHGASMPEVYPLFMRYTMYMTYSMGGPRTLRLDGRRSNTPEGLLTWCACGCGREAPHRRRGRRMYRSLRGHSAMPVRDRMLAKTAIDLTQEPVIDGSPCWIWTGSAVSGYGQVQNGGSMVLAHRLMYELWFGQIPGSPLGGRKGDGLEIDHLCRISLCINPAHLEPVDASENCQRRAAAQLAEREGRCINGHELTDETSYRNGEGELRCRTCERERGAEYRETNRDAVRTRNREWYRTHRGRGA